MYLFLCVLSSCGHQETLEDFAADMFSSKYAQQIESSSNNTNAKNRGVLSWMNNKSANTKEAKEESQKPSELPKIIDNSIQEEIVEAVNNEVNLNNEPSKDNKRFTFAFIKNIWNKFEAFTSGNVYMEQKADYKENSISVRQGLNIVVIKVPNGDEFNTDKLTDKNNVPADILEKYDIKDKQISSDIDLSKNEVNNYNYNLNNQLPLNSNISETSVYKNDVCNLRYKDIITKPDYFFTTHNNITNLHIDLINNLLYINPVTPNVLYVIYRDINDINDNSTVKNQIFLSSYLNKIRAFIYSKNFKNIFIQEVKLSDLPVNQILLVLKPITKEQFVSLPKQTNLYNANKISSKEWFNSVTAINEEAKQKQKSLYK